MNRLSQIAEKHHTDKYWYHGFTEFYYDYFKELNYPSILEIGTAGHGSTKMFLDFYTNCSLVGMDIIDYSDFEDSRFRFVCGDQSKIEDLDKCINNNKFDLILDDGSHYVHHQQISFGYLFDFLNHGGIYVIEDIHTSFIDSFIIDNNKPTTYEMVLNIKHNILPFSGYIDLNSQEKIIKNISFVEIYSKNPNDLSDSVTCLIKKK